MCVCALKLKREMFPLPCCSLQESCDTLQEMAERRVCTQVRGDGETELEFDEEFVAGSDFQRFGRQVRRFAQKMQRCLKRVYRND